MFTSNSYVSFYFKWVLLFFLVIHFIFHFIFRDFVPIPSERHKYVCVYMCVCVYVYICIYVYMCVCTFICVSFVHTQIYTHTLKEKSHKRKCFPSDQNVFVALYYWMFLWPSSLAVARNFAGSGPRRVLRYFGFCSILCCLFRSA